MTTSSSFAVFDMRKYIGRIPGQKFPVLLTVVRKLKEEFRVSVRALKKGSPVKIPLGKERTGLPGVAGLRFRLDPAALFHVGCEIFVDSHIFFGEKIVILVVCVEVFHDFRIERDFEYAGVPLYFDIAVVGGGVYGRRMARDTLSGYKPRGGFFQPPFDRPAPLCGGRL